MAPVRLLAAGPADGPLFYFHQRVDVAASVLQVEVLGPNLVRRFSHGRARRHFSAADVAVRLQRKTTGFLALVRGPDHHLVLAWAESGHGCGPAGDSLDPAPGLLANRAWARRAAQMARLLRPPGSGSSATTGLYNGSHVEVKLAVHAVHLLLRVFEITARRRPSLAQLRRLRAVCWADGSRPAFDIFFSRASCGNCLAFTRALSEATGVAIRLIHRPRLAVLVPDRDENCRAFGSPQSCPASDLSIDTVGLSDCPEHLALEAEPGAGERPLVGKPHEASRLHAQSCHQRPIVSKPLPATPEMRPPLP